MYSMKQPKAKMMGQKQQTNPFKKKTAKKEKDSRADARDAKRGGFISANAMKSSAKKANKAQADRKKRKSDELVSRGRK